MLRSKTEYNTERKKILKNSDKVDTYVSNKWGMENHMRQKP
jgi:hypothetical protein